MNASPTFTDSRQRASSNRRASATVRATGFSQSTLLARLAARSTQNHMQVIGSGL